MLTGLKQAVRSLARSPGFFAVAVGALGLGLGLTTTMFGIVDAVVRPYVPYRDPDRLYFVYWRHVQTWPMSMGAIYRFLRDNTRSFDEVVPFSLPQVELDRGSGGTLVPARRVTPRYFSAVGIDLVRGRPLVPSDEDNVALVSDALWRRLFLFKTDMQGAVVTIDGFPRSIIGVLPHGLQEDVWLPMPGSVEEAGESFHGSTRAVVRLRHGTPVDAATVELDALARTLTERFESRGRPLRFLLVPLAFPSNSNIRPIHKAMIGSAFFVLLIASINIGHLTLARGIARRREFAVRMALGASRPSIVFLVFSEAILITIAGAALGAVMAGWAAYVLPAVMPRELAWVGLLRPSLSGRVLMLSCTTSFLASTVFGLVPAIRLALAANIEELLKEDTNTATARVRLRFDPLLMGELALALTVVFAATLLLKAVHSLQQERPDVADPESLWTVSFRRGSSDTGVGRDLETALGAVLATRGVRAAAIIGAEAPMGGMVSAEHQGDSTPSVRIPFITVASGSYFQVLGQPILRGRDFDIGDDAGNRVAILDQRAAQLLFPNQDPVGRMLKLGPPASAAPYVTIVGLARSQRFLEGDERFAPPPGVFVSRTRDSDGGLLLRGESRQPATAVSIGSALRQFPRLGGPIILPYDHTRQSNLSQRLFLARLFVAIAIASLGLAAMGLYGSLSYRVSRRVRESAIRVALGAKPSWLAKAVLTEALVMILSGIGMGAFLAMASATSLDALLLDVGTSDVVSLVAAEAVVLAAATAAAAFPAWRAARVNPLEIMRVN